MSKFKTLLFIAGIFILSPQIQSQISLDNVEFVSPKPGSEYHNPECRIALRPGVQFDLAAASVISESIQVSGGNSGVHLYDFSVSRDGQTINIIPKTPFVLGETVQVNIGQIFRVADVWNDPLNWSFDIREELVELNLPVDVEEEIMPSVDREVPEITWIVEPQPGLYEANIFYHVKSLGEEHMVIHDFEGEPIWNDEPLGKGTDFKINQNGLPTYFNQFELHWEMLDTEGEFIRNFIMINGYVPDQHDFQILPNGNFLIFAYDPQMVDMSEVVAGGNPNAQVEGFVIQELDYDYNLILQWRSWDYLEITDNEEQNLLSDNILPFHINSVGLDTDDHVLISCRHTNEITKFHRSEGDIIWRLTINAPGDFTFLNDGGFSFQHDCRAMGNNRYLLFDNSNLTDQLSRAVEYELDLENNTATVVWEYAHPELLFGSSRGGCQRLPNGNTIIMWGSVSADEYGARTSEVSPDGVVLLEFAYPLALQGYRSPKHPFLFGEEYVGGCGDENAMNFNDDADFWLPEYCQYDSDQDGWTVEDGDCNDQDDTIFPGADEIPNDGIDQDCSGDDYVDLDEDGFSEEEGDCNDDDETINPDAEEIPNDGIDQDCDGSDFVDVDGDGFSIAEGDCNDDDEDINPDAEEIPYDGIDQDCDGEDLVDVDGDGFSPDDGDCDDLNEDINPDADEIANDGIDQDCDGEDLIVSIDLNENHGFSWVQNDISLNLSFTGKSDAGLIVSNMAGQIVLNRSFNQTLEVSLSKWSAGVYQCTLHSANSNATFKILVR